METITEGKIKLEIHKANKISKELPVFYNPAMELNRDMSILLLNALDKKHLQIALPLAGSGVRGIRFIKELDDGKIKSICFNDYSKDALNSIKKNFKINNLSWRILKFLKKIYFFNEDANLFLMKSKGFDYIDIDPFGSPIDFLDSSIKRISRGGILAITATDTAALSGTYPRACYRKYWSKPLRNSLMHEVGLRILIRRVQLIGISHEKALFPIFSYAKDHYMRVFFRCEKSKDLCNDIFKKHEMFKESGPMWIGNLYDTELVKKMIDVNDVGNSFLNLIYEESKIDLVGFYDIHAICKLEKLEVPKYNFLFDEIKKKGFKVSRTHFSDRGIKSNIDYENLLNIIKQ